MDLLEKRFGTIAVENDWISKSQLKEALELQVNENIDGQEHRLIGSILSDLGYMNDDQTHRVLLHLEGQNAV